MKSSCSTNADVDILARGPYGPPMSQLGTALIVALTCGSVVVSLEVVDQRTSPWPGGGPGTVLYTGSKSLSNKANARRSTRGSKQH